VPEFKDQFKDIASPRFDQNWKTDLDPAKLSSWLSRLRGRLMAHNARLGPVLDLDEHAWFNLTSTNDAQANWYIKANLWVGGQIVDQFDATSKRVENFFSTNNFAEFMYGRKLLAILERLYHVTSGPELRAAQLAPDSFVPFVMGMSPVDAEHAAFEQLRLHGRLPSASRNTAVGAESLLLLEKLPDAYMFKQTQLDEWYKGEVKNEPAWSLVELIKIIPRWLRPPPPSAHLAAFEPSLDFVAQEAGQPRAHAADGGSAEVGLSQEELGDLELDEYARAYAGPAERLPPQDFEWYSLDASSAEAHLWHHGAVAADVDTVCASAADAEPAAPDPGESSGLTVSKLDAALDAAATAFLSAVSGAVPAAPEPGEL